MSWFRMLFRDEREPDERSRKGAELLQLHADSTRSIRRAEQAILERDRLRDAIRNTVEAVRGR